MDYAATEPDNITRFHASNMCFHIDSDTAYIVQPKARSRVVGLYYLSENPPPPHIRPTTTPKGPILTKFQTIRTVMASAVEAETGPILLNGQQAVPIHTTLIKMAQPHPPTPINTNSATSYGILTSNMRQTRSNVFDMQFHWMH